jgi:hypothetical protein
MAALSLILLASLTPELKGRRGAIANPAKLVGEFFNFGASRTPMVCLYWEEKQDSVTVHCCKLHSVLTLKASRMEL